MASDADAAGRLCGSVHDSGPRRRISQDRDDGVHPRARGAAGQCDPRYSRQLCHPRTPQGPGLGLTTTHDPPHQSSSYAGNATPARTCIAAVPRLHTRGRVSDGSEAGLSGRRTGRGACGAYGAALQDLPRLAARRCGGLLGKRRLVDSWRKQRRFDRGQPKRRLAQRRAGQNAGRQRLAWAQFGWRLLALGAVVRDERFWGSDGGPRQHAGGRGAGERPNCQNGSEACGKQPLQHVASMRPRTDSHVGPLPCR